MKVYLSHSLQEANLGVAGYGTEMDRMREVAIVARDRLRLAGVETRLPVRAWCAYDANALLWTVVNDSNTWGSDLHICLHSNAGPKGADGTMVMHYPGSVRGKKIATLIYERVAPISPGSDIGLVTSPVFYETSHARAPVAYCELMFHTDYAEARHLLAHKRLYGEAVADAILDYFGISLPEEPPAEPAWRTALRRWLRLPKKRSGKHRY